MLGCGRLGGGRCEGRKEFDLCAKGLGWRWSPVSVEQEGGRERRKEEGGRREEEEGGGRRERREEGGRREEEGGGGTFAYQCRNYITYSEYLHTIYGTT